jgi:hypothetical protein
MTGEERRGNMNIRVTFDEYGEAIDIQNVDSTPVQYDPEEKITILGAKLKTSCNKQDPPAGEQDIVGKRGIPSLIVEFDNNGRAFV